MSASSQTKPEKLRLINHLSELAGASINDGSNRADFSLHYVTVDSAINAILRNGQGSFLSKVNSRNAFRLFTVRPADWYLLGIHWQGKYHHDRVLPFAFRSSCTIINCLTDALDWVLTNGCPIDALLHYFDDYPNVAGPDPHHA